MPISLLTAITDTRPTSARHASARASRSTIPSLSAAHLAELGPGAPGQRPAGVEDGVVLHGRAHQGRRSGRAPDAGLPRPGDGQVVGLGGTGGEHHLAEVGTEQFGDLLAGVVHGHPGPPGLGVAPRRVAEPTGEVGQHGLDRLGAHRGGGRVVEIGGTGSSGRPSGDPHRLDVAELVQAGGRQLAADRPSS